MSTIEMNFSQKSGFTTYRRKTGSPGDQEKRNYTNKQTTNKWLLIPGNLQFLCVVFIASGCVMLHLFGK